MSFQVLTSRYQLVAVLAVALACGKSESVDRRGEVIALTGDATAQRGDSRARPLHVGDELRGDDRIQTGDGAEIKIRLAHNGVTLVFDANADVVLGSQQAWTASGKVGAGVLERDPDDKTTAAGVHSEHEAATDPRAVLPDNATASPPDVGSGAGNDDFEGPRSGVVGGEVGGDIKGGDEGSGSGASKKGSGSGDDAVLDGAGGSGPDQPGLRIAARSGDEAIDRVARRVVARVRAALARCAGDEPLVLGGTLRFAKGRVTLEITRLAGAQRACVEAPFATIKVPAALRGTATISIGE